MNNLESIVPPLELCKLIPEGAFVDSALVYTAGGVVVPRYIKLGDTEHFNNGTPAPTLAEIIEKLNGCGTKGLDLFRGESLIVSGIFPDAGGVKGHIVKEYPKCEDWATAALRLYLEVAK